MAQKITVVGTAAVCAILFASVQVNTLAQSKTPVAPAKAAPAKAAPAKAAPAKAAPAKVAAAPAIVPVDPNSITMIGCLESDGTTYRLADVQGNQAVKGRSWKTGFITKKAKPVELVGAASSLNLKGSVGRKISVVGVKDGETHLKARSFKQLGSC